MRRPDSMRSEMRAEMAREMQVEQQERHYREMQRENGKPYKLEVIRPHPSTGRDISEIWDRGTKEELKGIVSEIEDDYPDDHTFRIVENG